MANKHTATQKEFIVKRLAAFEPPRAITAAFVAMFRDTKCDENDVLAVDHESGAILSPELRVLFLAERERVLLDPTSATYANKQARLIALSNHAKFYGGNNQFPEMRSVLRHIAEETGDLSVGGLRGGGKAVVELPLGLPVTGITRRVVDPVPPPVAVPAEPAQ